MVTTTKKVPPGAGGAVHLIVSDEENPSIPLVAGKNWRVTSVSVVSPELKKSNAIAARLCGGTSTCLALVEI